MNDLIRNTGNLLNEGVRRAQDLYDSIADFLEESQDQAGMRGTIVGAADNPIMMALNESDSAFADRLLRDARPFFSNQPNPETVQRMIDLLRNDPETRAGVERRSYDPDAVANHLEQRLNEPR